jgi:dTDP-4-dehydrorhamnose 3,5-epimerase-like enzyme
MATPEIIKGGQFVDDRGILSFVDAVPFENIKRVYIVKNFSVDTVRAFHGHKIEEKFVLVISGSAILLAAKMVGDSLQGVTRYVLSDRNPQVLHIPAGYANGFRALEPDTKVMFFSTSTITQAATDDYRFAYNLFGEDVWKVKSR